MYIPIKKETAEIEKPIRIAILNGLSEKDIILRLVVKFGFFMSLVSVFIALFYLFQYISGKITELLPRGIVVELEKGLRGFVPFHHLAKKGIKKPKDKYKVNEILTPVISSERIRQFLLKNIKRNKDKSFHWKINVDVL